jgi:hypothetical protein
MSQVIFEPGQGHVLPLTHLSPRFRNQGAFFGGEDVIRINVPLRLDEHTVRLLPERHKIAFVEIERLQHLARDRHLQAVTYASNSHLGR